MLKQKDEKMQVVGRFFVHSIQETTLKQPAQPQNKDSGKQVFSQILEEIFIATSSQYHLLLDEHY